MTFSAFVGKWSQRYSFKNREVEMKSDPSIIVKKGRNPGKIVTIMGGVHGNEPCGVEALRKAIEEIEIINGKVYFIFANLAAYALGIRQTQMNLNRAFRHGNSLTGEEKTSYERIRALELMPYLRKSVALLDIHSSSNQRSTPFIICEPHSFDVAKRLPFPIRSHGWDKIEPGGTDYYVNKNPFKGKGICIECGYHLDPEAPKRAYESILIFLRLMNMVDGDKNIPINSAQKQIDASFIYHTKTDFSVVSGSFPDFGRINEGTVIGYDGNRAITAPFDGVVIFPQNCGGPGEEAFIFGREE